MFEKKLLAELQAVETHALEVLNRGPKIGSIVQKIRGARVECEARVRYIEKHAKPAPVDKPAPAEEAPKAKPAKAQK